MWYIIAFCAGLFLGAFLMGFVAGSSQVEKEEIAYRCGYEQGKQDAERKES